jgi:hypothetical protein
MTAPDLWRWAWRAPAERVTLPAAGAWWTAAEILHHEHVSGLHVAIPVAIAASVTYGRMASRGRLNSARYAREVTVAMAALGGWAAAAAQYGVLTGPYCALTTTYAAGTLGGYWWLRHHDVVRGAREWRLARADWLNRAPLYGLTGSHLLDYKETWLGEELLLDITGTNRKASSWIAGHDLAETIAEAERLSENRVRVTRAGIAGRIRISVRRRDPWKDPLPHPVLEEVDGLELPVPCTVRKPVTVGYSPDDGSPMNLVLWDERGAKKILIVAMQGAGKSALLSCIRERITASPDALLWDINVGKAREDYDWAPACDLHAISSGERRKALRILLCARYAIEWRAAQPRKTADFHPDAVHPLIVVVVDEIDELLEGGDMLAAQIKKELTYIATKGRSEGVALIEAGQRGTASWVGGSDIRSQADTVIVGKVNRQSEVRNAIGEYSGALPDMTTYGEGEPGVWCVITPGRGHATGRSFRLTDPEDLQRLAAGRASDGPALEPALVAHLGQNYASLRLAHPVAHEPAGDGGLAHEGVGPDGPSRTATAVMDHPETSLEMLDDDLTASLPPDIRSDLERMTERAAETRRLLGESDAAARDLPDVDPAKIADAARQRWDDGARETGPLPPEIRDQLISMIGNGGASGRQVARAFEPDIKSGKVQTWLNRLRFEGVAAVYGKGRGGKWMLVAEAEALGLTPSGIPPGESPAEGPQE